METQTHRLVMIVAPGKVFLLLICRASAEVPMLSMSFTFPSAIKNYFVVIPHVIVIVIAVVNPVAGANAG
jgi:hypothetical protein